MSNQLYNEYGNLLVNSFGNEVVWQFYTDFSGSVSFSLSAASQLFGHDDSVVIISGSPDDTFSVNASLFGRFDTGDLYDDENALDGSDTKSITMRPSKYQRKLAPTIKPIIKRTMSGGGRTFIQTPVAYQISLSWNLFYCDHNYIKSLIAILGFNKLRLVIGDDTYMVTLLDEKYREVFEDRTKKTVTLNFEGRKI